MDHSKKSNRRKGDLCETAFSVQKGDLKCAVAPQKTYKPPLFVLNFG